MPLLTSSSTDGRRTGVAVRIASAAIAGSLMASTALGLSACRNPFGGGDDQVPSSQDIQDAADQQGRDAQSGDGQATGGGAGGDGIDGIAASTGFDDDWDMTSCAIGEATLSQEDIEAYQLFYDTLCCLQAVTGDGLNPFSLSAPGIETYGAWEQVDDITANFYLPTDDEGEGQAPMLVATMADGAQQMTLEGDIDGQHVALGFDRRDASGVSMVDEIGASIVVNDEYYASLPVDEAYDWTFAEDDRCSLRITGRTHDDEAGTIGYLIEVTNKTDDILILNDYMMGPWTIRGQQVDATCPRALPAHDDDGNPQPVLAYLAWDSAQLGGDLSDIHGQLVLTDYGWEEMGRYQLDIQ